MSAAMRGERARDQRARAQAIVDRGWYPFPVEYGGKRPGVGIKWGTATASVPTPKMLDLWFGRDPMNIGIAARPSGLVILDEDQLGAMERLCEAYGQPMPQTYRVRTAKGWHWYFNAPEHVEIGNSPGVLKDFGFDVRGGRGDGGYVVAAGSLHETGVIYRVEDDDADVVDMPWWIVELLTTQPEPVESEQAPPRAQDERRPFTLAEAQQFVKPQLDALKAAGRGEINEALNAAARIVAHFGPEFWTRGQAEKRLMQLQLRDWHDQDESAARATIASAYAAQQRDRISGARERATGRLLGWVAELVHDDPLAEDDEEGEDEEEKLLAREVEAQRRRLKAKRIVSAEGKEPLRVMRGAEFLEGPQLTWLVPGVAYHASTAKIFGPPGGGKTNFMLDIALRLATGMAWRGHQLEQVPVHFVMAEGEAVNRLRVQAFLHKNELDAKRLDDWWTAIPQGVLLTPEGIEDYLPLVQADRPGLVVLDTKNAMMDGNENDAGDVAVMIRAMRQIRDLGGRTCVALIDHTGLADLSRGRGSNAVEGAMDTEIRVTKARQFGGLVVFTAESTRDKAGPEDRPQWAFTLWPVDIPRPEGIAAPPVVDIDDAALREPPPPPPPERQWYEIPLGELPEKVLGIVGPGKDAAKDIYRVLLCVDDPDGLTTVQIRQSLDEAVGKVEGIRKYSRTSVHTGFARLKDGGLVTQGATASRWMSMP